MKFEDVVSLRIEKIKSVLCEKAKEYAKDGDRFHNFNVAARMLGITPERALKGMMLKHEVSVNDLIEMAGTTPEKLDAKVINEKITDNINYLILLEGMLYKRISDRLK